MRRLFSRTSYSPTKIFGEPHDVSIVEVRASESGRCTTMTRGAEKSGAEMRRGMPHRRKAERLGARSRLSFRWNFHELHESGM